MEKENLQQQYCRIKARGLNLNMSRGKPSFDTLDFSVKMLTLPGDDYKIGGLDCRNYGVLDGIPEAKELFAPMLGVSTNELIIGGNSSLQMMYDSIVRAMLIGVSPNSAGWCKNSQKVKFLCPVPGYDRHFAICESLGIEMLNIPSDENGPDMEMVSHLAANDDSIKGMWCIPIYSNPTGITYSDEVVRKLAEMPVKAKDFRLFWDCAYIIHHLTDSPDVLLNILDECKRAGNPDRVYMFASTSKITFPGAGLAFMAASEKNTDFTRKQLGVQTVGSDKLNQLRHVRFFKNYNAIIEHMKLMQSVLKPKFDTVLAILERELSGSDLGKWHCPNGGYFISFEGNPGTAARTVQLCKDAGVVLTEAGAMFPHGRDPSDSFIRIAPSFPTLDELREAMEVFCVSVKLAND